MIKKIRFYIGSFCLTAGLLIMPDEADASIKYNTNFLSK